MTTLAVECRCGLLMQSKIKSNCSGLIKTGLVCMAICVDIDCRVGEEIGSGQFGMVNKGKWLAADGGAAKVAIKTLRPEAKEEEKVKFLQEAAINGQFMHPNIVRLHGVVTIGEPVSKRERQRERERFYGPLVHDQVMIVLEFLPNGDLSEFLNSLKSR